MLIKFIRLENRINGELFFDKNAEIIVPLVNANGKWYTSKVNLE